MLLVSVTLKVNLRTNFNENGDSVSRRSKLVSEDSARRVKFLSLPLAMRKKAKRGTGSMGHTRVPQITTKQPQTSKKVISLRVQPSGGISQSISAPHSATHSELEVVDSASIVANVCVVDSVAS